MNIERLSLDQMRAFALVAELGSFSAAARFLSRAQSAVSYAVATLEKQLGIEVFDRTGYRPALTSEGQAVLHDIQAILLRTDRLLARSRALAKGLETDLELLVDMLFPLTTLTEALQQFRKEFPAVNLRVFTNTIGTVSERLLQGRQGLGIVVTTNNIPDGLEGFRLSDIELVFVAAPNHPLAREGVVLEDSELRDHVQLKLTDNQQLKAGHDLGLNTRNAWRLSDLWTKHQLLRAGMGWGSMPLPAVNEDIRNGVLKQLNLARYPSGMLSLPTHCVLRPDMPRGPATTWFCEWLRCKSH